MNFYSEYFVDEYIKVDNNIYFNCIFDGCIIDKTENNSPFHGSFFNECKFVGNWPEYINRGNN